MFECVNAFFKTYFWNSKRPFEGDLTITLISTTKSNFTLFYPNKNHSLKLTFDIFKLNTN